MGYLYDTCTICRNSVILMTITGTGLCSIWVWSAYQARLNCSRWKPHECFTWETGEMTLWVYKTHILLDLARFNASNKSVSLYLFMQHLKKSVSWFILQQFCNKIVKHFLLRKKNLLPNICCLQYLQASLIACQC